MGRKLEHQKQDDGVVFSRTIFNIQEGIVTAGYRYSLTALLENTLFHLDIKKNGKTHPTDLIPGCIVSHGSHPKLDPLQARGGFPRKESYFEKVGFQFERLDAN